MSKSKIIIILLVVLLILGGVVLFLRSRSVGQNSSTGISSQTSNSGFPSEGTNPISTSGAGQRGSGTSQFSTSTIANAAEATSSPLLPGQSLPQLRQISSTATGGVGVFDVATTTGTGKHVQKITETFLHYIERSTGHVFESTTTDPSVVRLTDTRIPAVYQAMWLPSGSSLYIRYLDPNSNAIDTYYATLKSLGNGVATATDTSDIIQYAPDELTGQFLPVNIAALVLSPSGTSLFTLIPNSTGGSQGTISKPDGSQGTVILNSLLDEWTISWPTSTIISLTTKPSGGQNGYMYFLTPATGVETKILGDIPGLTTLVSPDGKSVILSSSSNNTLATSVYTIKSGVFETLPIQTLPEKCVWSQKNTAIVYCAVPQNLPSANYPDDWYQGNISFNDEIMSINTQSGTTTLIANPDALVNQSIDATDLTLTSKEDYLYFINKKDGTLWSLRINPNE